MLELHDAHVVAMAIIADEQENKARAAINEILEEARISLAEVCIVELPF